MADDATFGRLEIAGRIELEQFWPVGGSDADTSKLLITVRRNGFRYFSPGARRARNADFYFDCVSARNTRLVDDSRRVRVRLQGVDAPELHAQPRKPAGSKLPSLKGTGTVRDFRQHQAETATVQLGSWLEQRAGGAASIACRFVSLVRHEAGPADAVDMFGRFVGDVLLPGDTRSINEWELENGVALVSLYDGMAPGEIRACMAAAERAGPIAGTVVDRCTARITKFDPTLIYRDPDAEPVQALDEGARRWIHPKLFRRQASWWAFNSIGAYAGSFREWLAEHGRSDRVWPTDAFLELGRKAPNALLADCLDAAGTRLVPPAAQMIFKEGATSIYRPDAASGERTRIRRWDEVL